MGYTLTADELDRVFVRFKEVAYLKKEMFDEDLEAIHMDEVLRIPAAYQLIYMRVMCGSQTLTTAAVRMMIDFQELQRQVTGLHHFVARYSALAERTVTTS